MSNQSSPFASTTPISISSCVALKGIGYSTKEPLDRHSQYVSIHGRSLAIRTTTASAARTSVVHASCLLVKPASLRVRSRHVLRADDRGGLLRVPTSASRATPANIVRSQPYRETW